MIGELLGARYKVINVLGSGGFGHTYIAEDTQRPGNPRCVLKHLTFASSNPKVLQQVRRLFQAEAETLENLGKHDQIPQLLAYFEENQEFYLVQEFIEGHGLNQELVEAGRWTEHQVIALLEDVLGILKFVHAQGVIHRDIKPDNLIRRHRDSKLVLIDFGAVKTLSNTITEASSATTMSMPIYTSGYAASEQCMGNPRYNSDIYSLGIVAIQALTGLHPTQLPQDFETSEIIWRDQIPVSVRLGDILDKMIRYNAGQRYQSAIEVLQDLQRLLAKPLNGNPVHTPTALPGDDGLFGMQASTGKLSKSVAPLLTQIQPTAPQLTKKLLIGAGVAVAGVAAILAAGRSGLLSSLRFFPEPSPSETSVVAPNRDRISLGERLLSQWQNNPDKQEGVQKIAAGDYTHAVQALEAARNRDRSDPETLIYLNNARIGAAKSYTIAVVVPLGDTFGSAQEILRGVAQAQAAVNQGGGIKGVPLKVAIANDDNKSAIAKDLAKALATNPEILAVIGHSVSDTTLAAADIYQEHQLVMVSPLSSAVQLSNKGSYLFRTMPSDRITAKSLSNYMLNRLKKKKVVIFFNSGSAYSQSLKTEFKDALFYNGVEPLAEVDLSRPDFDAFESVQQAIAAGAEVIMLATDHTTSDRAIQIVSVNRKRLKLLAGESLSTPKILKVVGNEAVGMVLAVPAALSRSPFQQQFPKLWGEKFSANWRAALAYDATQALIAAMQQDSTRLGIQRVMTRPDFSATGAEGAIKFLPSGDRQGNSALMTVVPVKSGNSAGHDFQLLP